MDALARQKVRELMQSGGNQAQGIHGWMSVDENNAEVDVNVSARVCVQLSSKQATARAHVGRAAYP